MIPAGKNDIVMIYNYDLLDPFFLSELNQKYEQLHLVAWSMGVWVAATIFSRDFHLFATRTAINGTLTPIDDEKGIKKRDVDEMIGNLSLTNLQRFYHDMFIDEAEAAKFIANSPNRTLNSIRQELVSLKKHYGQLGPAPDIYNTKIVGSRDRIFPSRSQVRSWSRDNCKIMPIPHYPFYKWNSLQPDDSLEIK